MVEYADNIRCKTLEIIDFIIKNYETYFSSETLDFVKHYCDVDEYEMAFEGLMIDSMERNINFNINLKEKLFEIGLHLNLDKESIFDSSFWEKFLMFVER